MDKELHIGQRKQEDNLWYEWNGEEWLLEVENHCTENVDWIKEDRKCHEDKIKWQKERTISDLNFVKESEGKLTYELDWEFIERMAKRMELNKNKYEPYNWKNNSIEPQKLKEAMSRHFIEVMKGNYEDDGEYGHLVALACNAMMIIEQIKKTVPEKTLEPSFDDWQYTRQYLEYGKHYIFQKDCGKLDYGIWEEGTSQELDVFRVSTLNSNIYYSLKKVLRFKKAD